MLAINQTFYITDMSSGSIHKFDHNWNYSSSTQPYSFPNVKNMIAAGNDFIITGESSIWKTNSELIVLVKRNISSDLRNNGIFYNGMNSLIYAAASYDYSIKIFDLNLTFINNISTQSHWPYSISGYNDQLFVGTYSGIILIIEDNQIISDTFKGCNGNEFRIYKILFDELGFMATACSDDNLYLYTINGTYKNKFISMMKYGIYLIGIDFSSGLVVANLDSGISIYY